MAKTVPTVRLLFSDLLYYGESQLLAKAHKQPVKISFNECLDKTEQYRSAWGSTGDIRLKSMQEIFGLKFYKNIIDAHLAPVFIPKSKPLILSLKYDADEFIDVLTHELFHDLFTDNQYVQQHNYVDLINVWTKLYGKRDITELVHLPVHAGLKAIYLDILNEPYRLERDIQKCDNWPEYKAAWQYVQDNDYKKIITDFSDSYNNLILPKD